MGTRVKKLQHGGIKHVLLTILDVVEKSLECLGKGLETKHAFASRNYMLKNKHNLPFRRLVVAKGYVLLALSTSMRWWREYYR